jgi:glycosyltransferase involved in cell wall biosynthesis
MISVCIPVYNFDVTDLVYELLKQITPMNIPIEIIVIDDCSENFKVENQRLEQSVKYIELSENIGRAKIRNRFLEYAKYEYMLFLDCDSLMVKDEFLLRYLDALKKEPNVICGGRIYPKKPSRNKMLSWKHGVHKESKPAHFRELNPNKSFMTNNFVVSKTCLNRIKFDERISEYGHEDTLFGYELAKKNIEIMHIDNPVLNGDIETNDVFLNKTKQGVVNLVHILKFVEYDKMFIENVSLLNYYSKSKSFRGVHSFLFKLFKYPIHYFLKKGYVNLKLFDFYKLGVLIEYKSQNFKK